MKIALAIIAFIFVGFMITGFIESGTPEGKAKSQARMAIDLCWSDHGKKSLSDDAKRFVAGACEKMEADFLSKYGVKP